MNCRGEYYLLQGSSMWWCGLHSSSVGLQADCWFRITYSFKYV